MFTNDNFPGASTRSVAPLSAALKRPLATSRPDPSIISANVTITGSIVSRGDLEIFGQVEGNFRAATLMVGEAGVVKGEMIAETVIVRGTFEGSIWGRRVQLCSGAKVRGHIFYAALSMESNSVFEGVSNYDPDPMIKSCRKRMNARGA